MLVSSPIQFPATSSPPAAKRSRPTQDGPRPKPKTKTRGGFMMDDSSDEDNDDEGADQQPPLKKQATESSAISQAAQLPPTSTLEEIDFQPTPAHSQALSEPNADSFLPNPSQFSLPGPEPLPFATSIFKSRRSYTMRTCEGRACPVKERQKTANATYESMVAARTKTKEGRAKRGYYGIDINELMDTASKEIAEAKITRSTRELEAHSEPLRSVEHPSATGKKPKRTLLWTEKYRARTFMDLCGDDATNRTVLRWLKKWDPIVFPGAAKKTPIVRKSQYKNQAEEEKPHRKILMLTGPPGLGKTTLAHVCARQAGYEVMEINASDERSKDVVKNRIRTSLGTESVKTVENRKSVDGEQRQKVARPACVVVDEVDGVVSGSGGSGEGGFVKALIDLVLLDQKNSSGVQQTYGRKKKKGDDFRLMRPLILICNDVYHPSLKPLRQSGLAEIVHAGKPSIDSVVNRLKTVFDKEGVPCDKDAARKVCEAAWGMASSIDARKGAHSGAEGDLRGVMVVGEWVAGRFRAMSSDSDACLTRQWLEKHVVQDLANGAGGARGAGRGSARDIVTRVFQEGGGFPKQALDTSQATKHAHELPKAQLGFSEFHKKNAMERLQQMIITSGEIDRVVTDILLEYPNREFNDDLFLTKPNQAYEWAHFHDACSSRLFSSQEWELGPYIGQAVLAYHSLFASPTRYIASMGFDKKWGDAEEESPIPFSGPRADFEAFEAHKQNRAVLQAIQGQLSPTLMRSFRSAEDVAMEFLPYLVRLLSPDVKPVVVGGSAGLQSIASVRKEGEKAMVRRAADVMADVGISLQKGKIESEALANRGPQWVYRMEPDIDALSIFETASSLIATQAPTRFAVRQVLDQELQASILRKENASRAARLKGGGGAVMHDDKENEAAKLRARELLKEALLKEEVKKDFFGRVIVSKPLQELDANSGEPKRPRAGQEKQEAQRVWVTYHEGLNNAVRKPISLAELMRGL